MHDINDNFDINLEEVSKVEGAASLEIKVRKRKIEDLKFYISEWKRFYTQAIRGKPVVAAPQLVARICGTCSNAHLLCSIKTIENAFGLIPSDQTMLLRNLLYYGLIIRDHGLHLYIFSIPDMYGKNSILDFDENDPAQKEILEDTFSVKEAGNKLSIVVGGRSVHAPMPTIGGFLKLPKLEDLKNLIPKLQEIRPKVLKLIEIFAQAPFKLEPKAELNFSGLISPDFSFLEGKLENSLGQTMLNDQLSNYLKEVIIPYSQARGFSLQGRLIMVGALARLNLTKQKLHSMTRADVMKYLENFPSRNIFHNNLAQAIEMLHAVDSSIEIISKMDNLIDEKPAKYVSQKSTGVGTIEAPRGTLFHKYEIDEKGIITKAEIIVPTGQNHVLMERVIYEQTEKLLEQKADKERIIFEAERLIRAFDPCMSCASHFLKVKWK